MNRAGAAAGRIAVIRADSSSLIGSGHVLRCLALGERLRELGFQVYFICRALRGNRIERVKSAGFRVHALPASIPGWLADARLTSMWLQGLESAPDWFIVDHYGLDHRYEAAMRPHVKRIMAIDDMEDRLHDCDVLLDHNWRPDAGKGYERLVPERCRRLLGIRYLLLDRSFHAESARSTIRQGPPRRVLVNFGGGDASALLLKTASAFAELNLEELEVHFITGQIGPRAEQMLTAIVNGKPFQISSYSERMAVQMRQADLAIGAGGVSAWERCRMGLPALAVSMADNQQPIIDALSTAGCLVNLGKAAKLRSERLAEELERICCAPALLNRMSKNCYAMLGDGDGAYTVAELLAEEVIAG